MTYAVKYLAGAYQAAGGNADRAVHYYASGYYGAGKSRGMFDRNGNATDTFAFGAADGLAAFKVAPERTTRRSRQDKANVTYSSDVYSGRPEIY